MEVVLINDVCIWVIVYIYDDVGFCFVGVYVMEWEEVFGFVLSDYFFCFVFDYVEMWWLFVVLFYVFVEWMFFDFYCE